MVHLTRVAGFLGATHSSSYMFGEWKASVWTFSVPLKSVWMWKWNQERAKEMGSPRSMAVKGMALHAFSWARDSSLSLPTLEALDLSLLRKMAISLGTSNMPLTFHLIISVLGFRFCMLHKTTEYDLASNDSKWTCISLQKLVPNSHEITQPNCQFGDKPVRQAVGSVGECKGVALCGWGFVCWVVGAGRAVSLFKGRSRTKDTVWTDLTDLLFIYFFACWLCITNKNYYLSTFEMVFCWWNSLEKSRRETEKVNFLFFCFVAQEGMGLTQ